MGDRARRGSCNAGGVHSRSLVSVIGIAVLGVACSNAVLQPAAGDGSSIGDDDNAAAAADGADGSTATTSSSSSSTSSTSSSSGGTGSSSGGSSSGTTSSSSGSSSGANQPDGSTPSDGGDGGGGGGGGSCGACANGTVCCSAPLPCAGQCVPDCRIGGGTCPQVGLVCSNTSGVCEPATDAGSNDAGGGMIDAGGGGMDAGGGVDAGGGGLDAGGGGVDAGCTTAVGTAPVTGAGVAEAQLSGLSTPWTDLAHGNYMDVSGGYAVAGSTGVFGGSKGKVTIFAWDTCNASWVEQTSVQGSDTIETDLFGSSLSLRGTSLVVGANYKDMGSGSSGEVYVFGGSGSSWSQTQKITAPTGAGQRFGLGIAQTSTTLALTSPLGKDPTSLVTYTGAIAVYTKGMNGLWQYKAILVPAAAIKFDGFGYSVAMDGNNLVGGAPGTYLWSAAGQGSGKAWVFNGSVATWNETGALVPSDGADNDWFGRAVAISGNTIIVGAPRHDSAGSDAGAAYIFSYANGSWTQTAKLTASDATANANFGFTVAATSETHVIVGASGAGKVYAFTKVNGTWTQDAAVQTACSGGTGWALGVSGNMIITGKTKATMFDLADPNTTCVGP